MIILFDSNEVSFFPTIAEALEWIEPIDFANGKFEAFDEDGQPLTIEVTYPTAQKPKWSFIRQLPEVAIKVPTRVPSALEREKNRKQLALRLIEQLKERGMEVDAALPLSRILSISESALDP